MKHWTRQPYEQHRHLWSTSDSSTRRQRSGNTPSDEASSEELATPLLQQQAAQHIALAHACPSWRHPRGSASFGAIHPPDGAMPVHTPLALPALPDAPGMAGTQSLMPWAPQPRLPGDMAAEITQNQRHRVALTVHNKSVVYGLWALTAIGQVILASVSAGAGVGGQASPAPAFLRSFFSFYDGFIVNSDHRYAHRDYQKVQGLLEQALEDWRTMARQVNGQPLDEASEQLLAATRYAVTLLAEVLSGIESTFLTIPQAKLLKAHRDLSLAAEDKWLERQRLPDTVLNAPQRAALDQEMHDLLDQLHALPHLRHPPATRRDLKRLQLEVRQGERRIRRLEKTAPHDPQLTALRAEQADRQHRLDQLRPFFSRGQGIALLGDPRDMGPRQLVEMRDWEINKITVPASVASTLTGLIVSNLHLGALASQGTGIAGSLLGLLLTPISFRFAELDMEVAQRERLSTAAGIRRVFGRLAHAVALKNNIVGESAQATIGRYLVDNQITTLRGEFKAHKQTQWYTGIRALRAQCVFLVTTPVAAIVLGSVALALIIVANVATAGLVSVVGLGITAAVLAPFYASIWHRLRKAKQAKDHDKQQLRIEQHLQKVLGTDYTQWIYTLSDTEFDRRMQVARLSAPKGLRQGLERQALLKHNKFVAIECLSRDLLGAAQQAGLKGEAVRECFAAQMLRKMGMSDDDVDYLRTCLPHCRDEQHYLSVCRSTIAAKVYKTRHFQSDRLPFHKRAASVEDTHQALLALLDDPAHAGLRQDLIGATSRDALHPWGAATTQKRLNREERLARFRAALLEKNIDPDDLERFRTERTAFHMDLSDQVTTTATTATTTITTTTTTTTRVMGHQLQWLLEVLIDPSEHVPSPRYLQPLAQAPQVQAPLMGHEVLVGAIQEVGHTKLKPWLVRELEGSSFRTPNPMGTAGQFLKRIDQRPELIDEVLIALKAWKLRELDKLPGPPTTPPGFNSMDDWLLAALRERIDHSLKLSEGIEASLADGHKHQGKRLHRHLADGYLAAKACAQRQEALMNGTATALHPVTGFQRWIPVE